MIKERTLKSFVYLGLIFGLTVTTSSIAGYISRNYDIQYYDVLSIVGAAYAISRFAKFITYGE